MITYKDAMQINQEAYDLMKQTPVEGGQRFRMDFYTDEPVSIGLEALIRNYANDMLKVLGFGQQTIDGVTYDNKEQNYRDNMEFLDRNTLGNYQFAVMGEFTHETQAIKQSWNIATFYDRIVAFVQDLSSWGVEAVAYSYQLDEEIVAWGDNQVDALADEISSSAAETLGGWDFWNWNYTKIYSDAKWAFWALILVFILYSVSKLKG